MNISVIGGGAWGTTLAQVLADNGHDVLIEDINKEFVDKINNTHSHPYFDVTIPDKVKATCNLKDAVKFSNVIVLCVPTAYIRGVITEINELMEEKKIFINVSKGIEPESSKLVSQIIEEVIKKDHSYVVLSGPSHAEEVILRKVTALVAASKDTEAVKFVQNLFNNSHYLRVYTSDDVIGVEAGGAIKNAIAIVSGVAYGMGLGENARALLISRGLKEFVSIITILGGNIQTVYGLSGVGDLIVTASSFNSRNFKCGINIGKGMSIDDAVKEVKQSVEGIRAIRASYFIGKKFNLDLPIINVAYEVIEGRLDAKKALDMLLSRDLKPERYW